MSELTQFHLRKFQALRTERGNFNEQWEEAASLIIPSHRDSFNSPGQNNVSGSQGQKKTEQQYDSTAAIACQRFTSVIDSLVTPKGSLWHRLVPTDKSLKRNRAARVFFDELNDLLFSYRYRPVGNFVSNSQQVYMGLGAYGNGTLFVDQPEDQAGLRYKSLHLGETYYAENHAGVIDTIYRFFSMTARQISQEKNWTVPEIVREQIKNATQAETKHEVLHCIYPREDYDPQRLDSKGMKYASLYVFVKTQDLLFESGYRSFPAPTSRYTQAPGELYGRGPAQYVLPAIKVLNEEKKTILKQGQRTVDPVYLANDDGNLSSVKSGAVNAGAVTAEGKPLVHVLPTGNIAVGDKMMEMERVTINDAFLITLFQILIDSPQMTATEVIERAREKGMLIAPTGGRIESEFLGRLIERELDLLFQQGLVPPLPAILQDAEAAQFEIEYDSPMTRLRRAENTAGFNRVLAQAAEYAKMTGDMEALDWFDMDVAIPGSLDINGAPASWTRSEEVVKQRRAARAEAAQAQQMVDAAPAAASVIKSVGGA